MFLANQRKSEFSSPRAHVLAALGCEGRAKAEGFLAACPRHAATPLHDLKSAAAALGIASLHIKDESFRMGLKSFKALGGVYAVMTHVLAVAQQKLGRNLSPHDIASDDVRKIANTITVTCATDGNHGRSVAAGARITGCKSVILMHEGVSASRVAAIAAFGAEILRVKGTYDDSVADASNLAKARGWTVISDTSYEGYEDIPLTVMQGYCVMAGEAFDALAQPPTHIFLQAGVGGLAAAVSAHALDVYGSRMPKIIVVEPERAACFFASAKAGHATTSPHGEPTIMGMLECYEPSRIAWEVLAPLADGFVTLPEASAAHTMRTLANPANSDPAIVSGESGGAGYSGLLACLRNEGARQSLGLDENSRVLVFNSEGATDAESYQHHVGLSPEDILK